MANIVIIKMKVLYCTPAFFIVVRYTLEQEFQQNVKIRSSNIAIDKTLITNDTTV